MYYSFSSAVLISPPISVVAFVMLISFPGAIVTAGGLFQSCSRPWWVVNVEREPLMSLVILNMLQKEARRNEYNKDTW